MAVFRVDASHMEPSLRFPEFSVKVVCHKNRDFLCGRLWKRVTSLQSLEGTWAGPAISIKIVSSGILGMFGALTRG